MRLKDPYNAGGAIGSFGGITMSMYKGQQTARARAKGVRRLRTTQSGNRSILGWLSRMWGSLSSGQRSDWESYAQNHPETNAFGQVFLMSGINAFTKLNATAIRLWGYGSYIEDPPTVAPDSSLLSFTVVTGVTLEGDIDVSWTLLGTGNADDAVELRLAGPYISPGRQEVFERKRYIQKVTGVTLLDTISDLITDQWYYVFGRYVDQYGQVTAWHSGQATPKVGI